MLYTVKQYISLFSKILLNEFVWERVREENIVEGPYKKQQDTFPKLDNNEIQKIQSELSKLEWKSLQKWNSDKNSNKSLQRILVTLWYDISYKNTRWQYIKWEEAIDWSYGSSVMLAVALLQADLWISPNNWIFGKTTLSRLVSKLDLVLGNIVSKLDLVSGNKRIVKETKNELGNVIERPKTKSGSVGKGKPLEKPKTELSSVREEKPLKETYDVYWDDSKRSYPDYYKRSNIFSSIGKPPTVAANEEHGKLIERRNEALKWIIKTFNSKTKEIEKLEEKLKNTSYLIEWYKKELWKTKNKYDKFYYEREIRNWELRHEKLKKDLLVLEDETSKISENIYEIYHSFDWEEKALNLEKYTPIDILSYNYKNTSEQEKIRLAVLVGEFMVRRYDLNGRNKLWDVSPEEMWNSEWRDAWVCRHIHSEVAKLLDALWIKAWMVSTNSWTRHAITWWQKTDGTFFMIDYWTYYEWKDPKKLMDGYLRWKWAIDFKETVADKDWKMIWILQTELERIFENSTSSIWTWNSLEYSSMISKDGFSDMGKWAVKVESGINSLKTSSIYWWLNSQYWLFHNNKDENGVGYSISWVSWRYNWEGSLWNFSIWWKLADNKFVFPNGKEKDVRTLWLDVGYSEKIYESEDTKIWLWAIAQTQIMQNPQSWRIEDATWNLWVSLSWEHSISDRLKLNTTLWIGWDILESNIRKSNLDFNLYDKESISLT